MTITFLEDTVNIASTARHLASLYDLLSGDNARRSLSQGKIRLYDALETLEDSLQFIPPRECENLCRKIERLLEAVEKVGTDSKQQWSGVAQTVTSLVNKWSSWRAASKFDMDTLLTLGEIKGIAVKYRLEELATRLQPALQPPSPALLKNSLGLEFNSPVELPSSPYPSRHNAFPDPVDSWGHKRAMIPLPTLQRPAPASMPNRSTHRLRYNQDSS